MTTPWSVPREWAGQTVAILASGPSMSQEVADYVRGKCRVIAVNNQGIDTRVNGKVFPALAPWADMLYAADLKWWSINKEQALRFAGRKVTIREDFPHKEVYSLLESREKVFDERPTHLATGMNSGYQAVHVAVHAGASRLLLYGFDMRAVDGNRHWFGDHPGSLNQDQPFSAWTQAFDRLARVLKKKRVEVLNCTPDSALRCFEFAEPMRAFDCMRAA